MIRKKNPRPSVSAEEFVQKVGYCGSSDIRRCLNVCKFSKFACDDDNVLVFFCGQRQVCDAIGCNEMPELGDFDRKGMYVFVRRAEFIVRCLTSMASLNKFLDVHSHVTPIETLLNLKVRNIEMM